MTAKIADSPSTSQGANNACPLDAAKARLTLAMRKLSEGTVASKELATAAVETVREKTILAERVSQLEDENRGLHDQIASLTLAAEAVDGDKLIADNGALKKQVADLERDKLAMTKRLDDTIAKLEILLEA